MITNEIIKSLSEYATPELCDGMEEKQYRIMDSRIRRQVTKEKIVGTAFTVRVPCQGGGLVPDAIEALGQFYGASVPFFHSEC